MRRTLKQVWSHRGLAFALATLALMLAFDGPWFHQRPGLLVAAAVLVWLIAAILAASLSVMRQAEVLAHRFGDPYGTLVLTLCATAVEATLVSVVMVSGEPAPTLARETMFAVVMVVLNGLVGASLIVGGLRHREQEFNLDGANAYLSLIIPLSIFGLVLPNFTTTTHGPTFSTLQALTLGALCVAIYVVFLGIQTGRHRSFFTLGEGDAAAAPATSAPRAAGLLLVGLIPVVVLSEELADILHFGTSRLEAPTGLAGLVVAALVLAPEGLSGIRAARQGNMQRSVNLLLGSVLATIALTFPTVIVVGLVTHREVVLGLPPHEVVLLVASLALSLTTFSRGRTNVLQGAIHLLVFALWVVLLFES